jgi:predicted dehydrogenase
MAQHSKIRAGFAGSGFAAGFHYDSLRQSGISGVEPVAVYSRTKERCEAFAAERELSVCGSIDELLDSIDVVHVCVPSVLHEVVAVAALERGVHVILEKPFTGYFGPKGDESFRGNEFSKATMRTEALASAKRIVEAESRSSAHLYYAENWLYAPAVQKEAEIVAKTGAQILWMIAEESHSGSHSAAYGIWRYSGGGSLMGKGCHPLTTVLYLKRLEGMTRDGRAIRPKSVSSRVHELTRIPGYRDLGHIRTDYEDVEDWGMMHVVFDDGTIADVYSSEIVLGGVHNWIEVFANNHRTRCNINPVDLVESYNPTEKQFADIYVVEKIGTKQGWSKPAPDENWMSGYIHELKVFYEAILRDERPLDYSELGYDTVDVIYSAYLSAERGGADVELVG